MHPLWRIVVAVMCVVAPMAPGRADACTYVRTDYFTMFDLAAVVAVAEVTRVPLAPASKWESGPYDMKLVRPIRGKPPQTLEVRTSCGSGLAKGEKVVIMLDEQGRQLDVVKSPDAVRASLVAWSTARTVAARRTLIKKLATHKDAEVRTAATSRKDLDARMVRTKDAWNQPAPRWAPPGTPAATMARLRGIWPDVVTAAAPKAFGSFEAELPRCELVAFKQMCQEAATQIRSTMGSSQDPATVGALANLDAGGVCWSVSCSRGFFSVMAYIAAYDGALLLVWQPPEG